MKKKIIGVLSGVASFLALPTVALAQTSSDGFTYTYSGEVDPATASQVAGTIGLASLVVVCIFMAIHIAITVWVYKDAKKRNANVALWTIVTFLFIVIGFIVYLLAGRKSGTPASTPSATPVSTN
jgi:quinol-cytochrome oxidoreductase complex cytochrome b subunit